MDFFIEYLRETVEALSRLDNDIITVRKIRLVQHISSSNRSRINFLWRALAYLVEKGIIEEIGVHHPKNYRRKTANLDLEKIINFAKKERSNLNKIHFHTIPV